MARIGTELIWIPELVWEQKVLLCNLSSRKIFNIGSILKQPPLDRRCFIHFTSLISGLPSSDQSHSRSPW
jgi:hypothetical protein